MKANKPKKQIIDLRGTDSTLFPGADKYGLSPEHIKRITARFRELQSTESKHEVAWPDYLW